VIRMLHITTVAESLGYFFVGQMSYMRAQGFDVHVLSSPSELLDRFAGDEQVQPHAVKMYRDITPLRDLVATFQIWRLLRVLKPQIVHAHTPKGGLLGMIAAFLGQVPVRIYHIHGLPFVTATGYRRFLLRWSERISCVLAHQVLCVSHSVREVVIAERICPASKVEVLVNGSINGVDAVGRFNPIKVGANTRKAVRMKYGIPDDTLVLGFVGRVVRDKGLVELVEAWNILRGQFADLHMMVVGPFEPQDSVPPDVEEILQCDSRVHITGQVHNVSPMYASLDILVLPSHREGFGLVAIEASAMKLPVVATSIAGCVDAVQDGVTGVLVPPHDVDALVKAISEYVRDSALRIRHGQAGRARVLRDFRPEAIREALRLKYTRLLQEKGLQLPVASQIDLDKGLSTNSSSSAEQQN